MIVSMLLHSMISIRDNSSLGTFHKTFIQQRGSMSDGPNCQTTVFSVSLKCSLFMMKTIYIKNLLLLSVWLCEWPSPGIDNRSGSDRSSGTQERGTKDNPVWDSEHSWHPSTVHWRPSMQTTWSPAQSLIRYLVNVFWDELNIFF